MRQRSWRVAAGDWAGEPHPVPVRQGVFKGWSGKLRQYWLALHRQFPVSIGKIASETLALICVQDFWSRSWVHQLSEKTRIKPQHLRRFIQLAGSRIGLSVSV